MLSRKVRNAVPRYSLLVKATSEVIRLASWLQAPLPHSPAFLLASNIVLGYISLYLNKAQMICMYRIWIGKAFEHVVL